jgi:hypothetical protein
LNNQSKNSTAAGVIVTLLTLLFGYGFIHRSLESGRPPEPKESVYISSDKVESRLWQDPFEAFESATNQSANTGSPSRGSAAEPVAKVWDEIEKHSMDANIPMVVLGVMLEGGSLAEDKEVRLRTRYAVEIALLTQELGPDDRTHISTNSVCLTLRDDNQPVNSHFAYELFEHRTTNEPVHVCVLWLNEDDFADRPALRLGALFKKIPSLTNSQSNANFYLVGPRASDTLRSFKETDTSTPSDELNRFEKVIRAGRFNIFSPEATASVRDSDSGDADDLRIRDDLEAKFGATNFFHNWIATDQQIATLLSCELTNRLDLVDPNSDNVVVLLSEQDTYYGRKLADEWVAALQINGVCRDADHVWQFEYLAGLDGSKPQARTQDQSPVLSTSPEAALQTALQQQQQGQRSDGDAQLDYIIRLGEFLKEKDTTLKKEGRGRILAFGLTGSDAYDKLVLLRELRSRFPGAVFFTADLDASLWTTKDIKYTRDLLVGSAYPLDPFVSEKNTQSLWNEFMPFRDVYQNAVFQACYKIINHYTHGDTNYLEADEDDLQGGLYVIGRHGPVRLATASEDQMVRVMVGRRGPVLVPIAGEEQMAQIPATYLARWPGLLFLVVTLGLMVVYFHACSTGGIQRQGEANDKPAFSVRISKAEKSELNRQISLSRDNMETWLGVLFLVGLLVIILSLWVRSIVQTPGEEPWNFSDAVSIWPSEFIRILVVALAFVFFYVAKVRRRRHRKKLWKDFFSEGGDITPEDLDEEWDAFYSECRKRWSPDLTDEDKRNIIENDAIRLWKKSGRPTVRDDDRIQAEIELEREQKVSLVFGWLPPFIRMQSAAAAPERAYVDASVLFKSYLNLGRPRHRFTRIGAWVLAYTVLAISIFWYLDDIPECLQIRGHQSHLFDHVITSISVLSTLMVLFYVFDAALVTRKLFDYLSRRPTCWPDPPLLRHAVECSVMPKHLDGLVDVEFAAVQTAEIGPLMFWPVILQLLLLTSRSPCFDEWTWPLALILVFILNFLGAAICWFMVRDAAGALRKAAIKGIDEAIVSVKNDGRSEVYNIPFLEDSIGISGGVSQPDYLAHLDNVKKKIADEDRGAFAPVFQDPSLLAVFIPSGATGIISLIISFWLGK